MKIFFPLEVFYPSQAGGPANTVYWITKYLKNYGYESIIVSTDKGIRKGFPLNKWLDNESGKAIYIKTHFLHFPVYQTIISLVNFYRADIVHVSSIFFPTAFMTAFAAKIFRKKLAWSVHGELDPAALNHSRRRKRPILFAIKNLIGKYSVFHSTCDEETQYIKDIFGNDASIVQISNYMELPQQMNRKPSNYLLYIGRIHPKKAIDNLLKALIISEDFLKSDYKLKIAGRGKKEFEDNLLKTIKELNLQNKVEFIGQVEGLEKEQLLANAFWTIMPSHTENFGIVVIESLAQSTPVLASKGSPWGKLETEKIGIWTENSPENLAVQISRILNMPEDEYENYRAGGRSFVEREFDIEANIQKWIDFYKNL